MDNLQKLADLIGKALGADQAEIVRVPEGKTIEDVIRERHLKPAPDAQPCANCGEIHEFVEDESEEPEEKLTSSEKQARAVASLNKRIAQIEEGVVLLRKLRDSTAMPVSERKPLQIIEDIATAFELRKLGLL